MGLITWLFAKTPAAETPAPDLPDVLIYAELQAHLDAARDDEFDDDDIEEEDDEDLDAFLSTLGPEDLLALAKTELPVETERSAPKPKAPKREIPDRIDLEPVYTVIDYCDAQGHTTRRRITMLSLRAGPHAPLLSANCHERKAMRSFRCDRIEWFLEPDGEAIRPDAFFRDIMDIDLSTLPLTATPASSSGRPAPSPALDTARKLREKLRAPLSLLIAAARADDELHPQELEVIFCYAEDAAMALADTGYLPDCPTVEVLDHLNRSIAKMRPQAHTMINHLKKVLNLPQSEYQPFAAALQAVIDADGHVALGEELFLADLAQLRARVLAQ